MTRLDATTRRILLAAALACGSLAGGTPASAAQLVTWESESAHVDASKEPLGSSTGEPREGVLRVNVYLPDRFNRRRCFPVLYLMHGAFGAYDHYVDPTKIDLLELASGFPGVIVMPDSGEPGVGVDYWNGGKRGDPGWASYHLDELIPLVERKLEICPGRRNRAIGGASAGGLTATLHAAARPGYFGSVAAFSAPLAPRRPEMLPIAASFHTSWPEYFGTEPAWQRILGDPIREGFYWEGHDPLALVEALRHSRVFLSHGDGIPRQPSDVDRPANHVELLFGQMTQDFTRAADAAGVDYTYFEHEGVHDHQYFRLALVRALEWGFFEAVPKRPRRWTYRTVRATGRMWDVSFEFAAPPQTVATFERRGARLRGSGSGTVTIRTRRRCEFTVELPFRLSLRSKPRRRGKSCGERRPRIGSRTEQETTATTDATW